MSRPFYVPRDLLNPIFAKVMFFFLYVFPALMTNFMVWQRLSTDHAVMYVCVFGIKYVMMIKVW